MFGVSEAPGVLCVKSVRLPPFDKLRAGARRRYAAAPRNDGAGGLARVLAGTAARGTIGRGS